MKKWIGLLYANVWVFFDWNNNIGKQGDTK